MKNLRNNLNARRIRSLSIGLLVLASLLSPRLNNRVDAQILIQPKPFVSDGGGLPFRIGSCTFDTPSGGSATSNFLNCTGTLPTTITASTIGVDYEITSAGSSSQQSRAFQASLLIGYTGSSATSGGRFANAAAGIGTSSFNQGGAFNTASISQITSVTVGHNVGSTGTCQGSSTYCIGMRGMATSASGTPLYNIGVLGSGLNGATASAGGYFTSYTNSTPLTFTSAALIANNVTVAEDIFRAEDNSIPVFTIPDGGGALQPEITAPSAPAANNGILFIQDDGAGKSQGCLRFPTGAIQCFASEP